MLSKFLQNGQLFVSYAWYSYRALFTWLTPGSYLTLKILNPVTQVLFFTLLGKFTGGDPSYYVIGNSTQLAVTTGIFGMIQVISTERSMGTLPQLIMTPTSSAFTFYGRSLFLVFEGTVSQGMAQIASPNNSVLVVGRVFVESDNDLPIAYGLAKQIQLTPLGH